MLRSGFDVRTVQHWMGHKSLERTMRYLAPATDVHDALDLVTIPSLGKAAPAPRKSAARGVPEDWERYDFGRDRFIAVGKNLKAISIPRSPSRSIVC
jgi:hypothetical protein